MHQADVAEREADRHAGADQGPLARLEGDLVSGPQIGARITGMGVCRQRQPGVEPPDLHGDRRGAGRLAGALVGGLVGGLRDRKRVSHED